MNIANRRRLPPAVILLVVAIFVVTVAFYGFQNMGYVEENETYFFGIGSYVLEHPSYAMISDFTGYNNTGDRPHFMPLFFYMMSGLVLLFGDSHSAMSIFALMLHVVNAAFVGFLAYRIFQSLPAGILALLFYSINYQYKEPIFEYSVYLYVAPAMLFANCGLALILFSSKNRWLIGTVATLLLGISLMFVEYPVGYMGGYVAAWWFSAKERNWQDFAKLAIPLSILLILLASSRVLLQPYLAAQYGIQNVAPVFKGDLVSQMGLMLSSRLFYYLLFLGGIPCLFALFVARKEQNKGLSRNFILLGICIACTFVPVALAGFNELRYHYAFLGLFCVLLSGALVVVVRYYAFQEKKVFQIPAFLIIMLLVLFFGRSYLFIQQRIEMLSEARQFEKIGIPHMVNSMEEGQEYHVVILTDQDPPELSSGLWMLLATKLASRGWLSFDLFPKWRIASVNIGKDRLHQEFELTDENGRKLSTYRTLASFRRAMFNHPEIAERDRYIFLIENASKGKVRRLSPEEVANLVTETDEIGLFESGESLQVSLPG